MGASRLHLARLGRTSPILVVAAFVVVAGIAALILTLREPAPAPRQVPSTEVERAPTTTATPNLSREPLSTDLAPAAKEAPAQPASTEKVARLRVRATLADGVEYTGNLTLDVDPIAELGRSDKRSRISLRAKGPRVEVEDALPGRYRVTALASGRRSATIEVDVPAPPAAPIEVTLALESAGVFKGRLVDTRGQPLDGLEVTWIVSSGLDRGRETTDAEGRFSVGELREGTYVLLIGPELAPIHRIDALEHRGRETDLGNVEIAGLGLLRITVRDFAGSIVPGARVWEAGVTSHFDLLTDVRGQCIARHLPAGQYRVFASEKFHGEVNKPVELPAGGEGDLTLVFER